MIKVKLILEESFDIQQAVQQFISENGITQEDIISVNMAVSPMMFDYSVMIVYNSNEKE